MRGGMGSQVTEIFNKSGIFTPGESKHEAKELAREGGAATWADMGRELGIYSYNTAETYKDVWHQFGDYAKFEMGLKDIEKTTENHVKAYLESRIAQGIAYSTYQKEAAALGKLENALNMYSARFNRGNDYNFRPAIRECGTEARNELEKSDPHRAYRDPEKLIASISNENHKIAASVQYEGGARIHEASLIKNEQLGGFGPDKITGECVGQIRIEGKGGKERTLAVSTETYRNIEKVIERDGEYRIDKNDYRHSLREAAEKVGQEYNGSHGLRWSYAQERMEEAQENGRTYEQALVEVSHEMGHERADITEHYLR